MGKTTFKKKRKPFIISPRFFSNFQIIEIQAAASLKKSIYNENENLRSYILREVLQAVLFIFEFRGVEKSFYRRSIGRDTNYSQQHVQQQSLLIFRAEIWCVPRYVCPKSIAKRNFSLLALFWYFFFTIYFAISQKQNFSELMDWFFCERVWAMLPNYTPN